MFTVKKELRFDGVSNRYLVKCGYYPAKRYAVISSHKKLDRGEVLNCVSLVAKSNSREYLMKNYN